MTTEFLMPKLGLTMEEGTILQWLVDDGANVVSGTPVMVIETDKVESDVEANGTGRLHRIGEQGQTFRCGEVIALLLADDESVPASATDADQTVTITSADVTEPQVVATFVAATPAPLETNGSRRFVSPNARRIAAARGIDLGAIRGTGPKGRVVSEDLDHVSQARPTPNAAGVAFADRSYVPAASITMDADVDAVEEDRFLRSVTGKAPTYTDYVIAAVGRALKAHPGFNAQVTHDGIELLPDVHVGLAIALDDDLVVPMVRNVDRLPIADLATEARRLRAAARQATLTTSDLEVCTFSVEALGMFGVDAFQPVLNPPNVAILGIGRIRDDLTLTRGVVGVVRRMTLSLTWDQRVLASAPAANFCKTVVELLNDPAKLD